jgi:hypothetical protein
LTNQPSRRRNDHLTANACPRHPRGRQECTRVPSPTVGPTPHPAPIAASPDAIYDAFRDPAVLMQWLPPVGMSGRVFDYDFRVGGCYRAGAERGPVLLSTTEWL